MNLDGEKKDSNWNEDEEEECGFVSCNLRKVIFFVLRFYTSFNSKAIGTIEDVDNALNKRGWTKKKKNRIGRDSV